MVRKPPPFFLGTRTDLECRAIESFQKGETATFIQHIEKGVEIALGDPESLLVFSGYVRAARLKNMNPTNDIYTSAAKPKLQSVREAKLMATL